MAGRGRPKKVSEALVKEEVKVVKEEIEDVRVDGDGILSDKPPKGVVTE